MVPSYLDGFLHAIGVCTIDNIVQIPDAPDCRVSIFFQGGELVINVPSKWIKDDRGVNLFKDGDVAFINIRLGIQSNTKSFNGQSYSKIDIALKRVMEFRKLTAEESKAI